jgi:hypothetical protein
MCFLNDGAEFELREVRTLEADIVDSAAHGFEVSDGLTNFSAEEI